MTDDQQPPAPPTAPWDAYAATLLEVVDPEEPEGWRTLEAADLDGRTAHLITSDNPRSVLRTEADNSADRLVLADSIEALGATRRGARGRSPDGEWAEVGYLVFGLVRADALSIGRRFGQHAIFEVDPAEVRIIDCATHRVVVRRPLDP